MTKIGNILLITGPAGSGKSTLAQHVADKLGWQCVSEDDYWVNNGWGSGLRSVEQEQAVQEQVLGDVVTLCWQGKGVVLEFILYKDAPNPLTAYMEGLAAASIECDVVALKPSVDEILKRRRQRGRASDLQKPEEEGRLSAENQLRCLEAAYIDPEWVIDSTDISIDPLTEQVANKLRLPS